jgi:hypothetical protein
MADEREFKVKITVDAAGATAGSAQAAAALTEMGGKGSEANKAIAAETEKVIGKKAQSLKALRELGREFPILGALGRLAFNPLALAAAGVTMLFQRLKQDIANLEQSLTASTWETYGGVLAAQNKALSDASQGASAFAGQMERLLTATQNASTAGERLVTVFKAQMSAQDQVDSARKALELARVEASGKGPVQKQMAVLEIEERYAARKRARDEQTSKFEIEQQRRKMEGEGAAAQALGKQLETARNQQQGLESEAAITEKLRVEKGRLATITDEEEKKSARHQELVDKGWAFRSTPQQMEMNELAGQLDSLSAQKYQQQGIVGRLEAAAPKGISRWRQSEEAIKSLEGLQRGAAERGLGIAANLATQEQVAGIESGARAQVGSLGALADSTQALSRARESAKKDESAILKAVTTGTGFSAEALRQMEENTTLVGELTKRVRELEGRAPRTQ